MLQPLPLRPVGALGKDVTISPHISWVVPDISKMLFPGCYFGREIAFPSPVLPYCPRPGIEEYARSQRSMETCPKQEYFILILKEFYILWCQFKTCKEQSKPLSLGFSMKSHAGLKPASVWGDLLLLHAFSPHCKCRNTVLKGTYSRFCRHLYEKLLFTDLSEI